MELGNTFSCLVGPFFFAWICSMRLSLGFSKYPFENLNSEQLDLNLTRHLGRQILMLGDKKQSQWKCDSWLDLVSKWVDSQLQPITFALFVHLVQVQIFNPAFFKYIHDRWTRHHGRYPSTGMLVLFFALHVCDEVSAFLLSSRMFIRHAKTTLMSHLSWTDAHVYLTRSSFPNYLRFSSR